MARRRRKKIIPPAQSTPAEDPPEPKVSASNKPSTEPAKEPSKEPAKKVLAKPPAKRKKLPPRDPQTETVADTKLVNALESNPEFFRDPLIGKTLGKCKIEKLIGEGKTSVVYRAHYEPLKRTVAVKVLQDHMAKMPAVLRVFQQEGRAVAAIDHEHVLKIYGVGEDQGHYFLILELLRGKELRELIDSGENGRLGYQEALEYTRQAARGLVAAHSKRLIHRDIKPQNLVVEPDGLLKIVDFGLAAEAEGAFAGGRLGTPHYMSPEQCRGELATPASDIYALGVTLFHMLVGHAPYKGAKTTDEIIDRHLEGKRLEPEKYVPEIPGSVCELVRRMTRMNANQRPSALEIADAIDKVGKRAGSAGRGRTAGARGVARRSTARRVQGSGSNTTVIAVVVGVVILAIVAFLMMGGKKKDDSSAGEPTGRASNAGATAPIKDSDAKPKVDPKKEPNKASGDKTLDVMMEDARIEERSGNFREAVHLYERVMQKTKENRESPYYKEALSGRDSVKKALRAERRGTRAKRVTLGGTEQAAKEFASKLPEFRARLARFQVAPVIAEMESILKRTRKDTAAYTRIRAELDDVEVLRDMLGIVEGRADALGGGAEKWERYDTNAEPGLIVLTANQAGVTLRTVATNSDEVRGWSSIPKDVRIALLDALRAPTSGMDAFRLGYYCWLIADERAESYFDMAVRADSSLSGRIRKLRASSAADSSGSSGED